jgi:hypothetical protein
LATNKSNRVVRAFDRCQKSDFGCVGCGRGIAPIALENLWGESCWILSHSLKLLRASLVENEEPRAEQAARTAFIENFIELQRHGVLPRAELMKRR